MTNEEILIKAIQKAVANEYTDWGVPRGFAVYSVIFSHDFAKAFWGDAPMQGMQIMDGVLRQGTMPTFAFRLQQMVLEKDPIKYLEKFL